MAADNDGARFRFLGLNECCWKVMILKELPIKIQILYCVLSAAQNLKHQILGVKEFINEIECLNYPN